METEAVAAVLPEQLPRDRVVHYLRRLIAQGRLTRGDRLPPELKFASLLGVSRSTVRAGFAEAEQAGLIETRPHKGRWVLAEGGDPTNQSDSSLIKNSVALVSSLSINLAAHRGTGMETAVEIGTQDALLETGANVLLMRLTPDNAREVVTSLCASPPRGVIIDHTTHAEDAALALMRQLQQAKVPTVVYSNDDRYAAFDRVASDQEGGAHALTQALIDRGCRRILLFRGGAHAESAWQKQRQAGHERALRENGLTPLPPLNVHDLMQPQEGVPRKDVFRQRVRQMGEFLVQPMLEHGPPDAIMTVSDGQIFAVAAALRLFGKRANEDILLAGYDNYWWSSWERQFEPCKPCLTVDKSNEHIGRVLTELLRARVAGELPDEPQCRWVPPRLVEPE